MLRVAESLFNATFTQFRRCGGGARECQALWVGPWSDTETVNKVVHREHSASSVGFDLDPAWLARFWWRLGEEGLGVRAQVHTHPGRAYHSPTDDAFPIVHTVGFLSLVIPRFATGPAGLDGAFLAQIIAPGQWAEVEIAEHLEIVDGPC